MTIFLVLEAPRDQDQSLKDYSTVMVAGRRTFSACPFPYSKRDCHMAFCGVRAESEQSLLQSVIQWSACRRLALLPSLVIDLAVEISFILYPLNCAFYIAADVGGGDLTSDRPAL